MLTAVEADERRREIRAAFSLRIEQCQRRHRIEAEAILRARKHLTPLCKIIRARELLRDIYTRETAELTELASEQGERLHEIDVQAPPLTEDDRRADGDITATQFGFYDKKGKIVSAMDVAELEYLNLPSIPESVASAKRKAPAHDKSSGSSKYQRLTAWSPLEEVAQFISQQTPGKPAVTTSPAVPLSKSEQRAQAFEQLLDFARSLTDKEEHESFMNKLRDEFRAVNGD